MSKSCIITVTSGDFEYIDEWIEHNRKLGVDLFFIGYNGPSEDFKKCKQYDFVHWVDFSYNSTNLLKFKHANFGGWKLPKMLQILFTYVYEFHVSTYWDKDDGFNPKDLDYCLVIETDEFLHIKNPQYDNINTLLDDIYCKDLPVISLCMDFYSDNNYVYKTNEPCQSRFTKKSDVYFDMDIWHSKPILNLNHPDIIKWRSYGSHLGNLSIDDNGNCLFYPFDINTLTIKHFYTKTIEEWIEKMNPDVDPSYFERFRGHIFFDFFGGVAGNKITDEKIKAIPELLNKYNIIYDVNEEWDSYFKERYFEIFPEQKHN